MKKKRIYKKYLTMNPEYAAMLYNEGKISYEKYKMAFYSSSLQFGRKDLMKTLIEIVYG